MTMPPSFDSVDVLRWPVIGSVLRWRHVRSAVQGCLLLVAVVVVLHGLWGPQIGPRNLATVLTWVHYRGLLIGVLLVVGNVFCGGCPFVLVRDLGRRVRRPTHRWPRQLRGKWIGLALLVTVLFAYELFDLWALPRATAWLILGYFGAALAVDLAFTGASFCKYLCPLGQFNFIASTMSPLELRVRETATCHSCQTADCIKGRRDADRRPALVQRGCELGLFLPSKVGNLDCTFCLDCVHACPHDNIAVTVRLPAEELASERRHSGIGRPTHRADLAALAVVFTFGALLNALAMTEPIYRAETWLGHVIGARTETPVLALVFVFWLGVAPFCLCAGAAAVTRLLARRSEQTIGRIVRRYAYALVPLGFGVWLAHYGFHLLTGGLTVLPVLQSAAVDATGWALLGEPRWHWTGLRAGSVLPFQLGCVLAGTIGSIALNRRISDADYAGRAHLAAAPWTALVVGLAILAIWIFVQPMEMRGTSVGG